MIKKLIGFDSRTLELLKQASKDKGMTITTIVRTVVMQWLKDNNYK